MNEDLDKRKVIANRILTNQVDKFNVQYLRDVWNSILLIKKRFVIQGWKGQVDVVGGQDLK